MQPVMKPQNVNLTTSAAQTKTVPSNLKTRPTTQQNTGRRFLDCLMAALSGLPV